MKEYHAIISAQMETCLRQNIVLGFSDSVLASFTELSGNNATQKSEGLTASIVHVNCFNLPPV